MRQEYEHMNMKLKVEKYIILDAVKKIPPIRELGREHCSHEALF